MQYSHKNHYRNMKESNTNRYTIISEPTIIINMQL